MNPIMQLGYSRPLKEKDIWRLDTWDRTETLNDTYVHGYEGVGDGGGCLTIIVELIPNFLALS